MGNGIIPLADMAFVRNLQVFISLRGSGVSLPSVGKYRVDAIATREVFFFSKHRLLQICTPSVRIKLMQAVQTN
jgi:hypothetical protein